MNDVHPTAVLGDDVELGDGNVIGPFAVVLGPVRLGDRNWIGPHVVIGTPAEIRGIEHGTARGSDVGTGIVIGDGNVLREYTTVHQGHYATTSVGNDCYLMNKVYLAHDNQIGDGVTIASGASLGGHVHVGAGANLGMGVVVHQRRIIGPGVMLGMGSIVTRDVPPYALAFGNPCRVRGANRVGMERAGVSAGAISAHHAAYTSGIVPSEDHRGDATSPAWAWWNTEMRTSA